jgi:heptaprenyl diphosphate synthase
MVAVDAAGRVETAVSQVRAELDYLLQRRLPGEISAELIPLRGKFNRARLVLGFAALGGEIGAAATAVAAGAELLHLASLLQDDLVDQSRYRQGKLAFFNVWGSGAAVLLSDWLFGEAYRLIGRGELAWVEPLNRMVERMALSELQQVIQGQRGAILSVFGSLRYSCNKTAVFFANCCKFGFQTAKKDPRQTALAGKIGLWWGMAYQFGNDLQDLLTSPASDRDSDHDRQRGLFTLPVLLLLRHKPELKLALRTLPQPELLTILQNTGVIQETLRMRQNCLSKARRALVRIEAAPAELELICDWLEQSKAVVFPAVLKESHSP